MSATRSPAASTASISSIASLRTDRLLLRQWRDEDLAPFAAINADRRVVQFLPAALTRKQSDANVARFRQGFRRHGFGVWAVERTDQATRPFIGFVGISVPRFNAHFTPCVEILWRLAPEHWGLGLCTEGALAVAAYAFATLKLNEIVSFTVPDNHASRRVMEKIGMLHDRRGDFDHPSLPPGDRLRRHVLYRLASPKG